MEPIGKSVKPVQNIKLTAAEVARAENALTELRKELQAEDRARLEALEEEGKLQTIATQIESEMRPLVAAAAQRVHNAVLAGNASKLITVTHHSPLTMRSDRIVLTTFQIRENHVFTDDPAKPLATYAFKNGEIWVLRLNVGRVQSSKTLMSTWDESQRIVYPYIRLWSDREALLVIGFNTVTKARELRFDYRNAAREAIQPKMDQLTSGAITDDIIADAVTLALRDLRYRKGDGK